MNKDYIDALWHEAELASINSDLEIHQIFYKLIENNIRADEREACARTASEYATFGYNGHKIAKAIRARGEVK